ncbi:MAG: hypothetical protein ACRC4W_06270 [Treponemataceae bacterium]
MYSSIYNNFFIDFEDAVYNQTHSTEEILQFYDKAMSKSSDFEKEEEQLSYLSACQELLGRHYLVINDEKTANEVFEKGISYANESLKVNPTALAYSIYAQNITQNMRTKSVSYIISNGKKMEKMIKEALELSPEAILPQYLTISRYVFAPAAFNNPKKGLEMITTILSDETANLSQAMKFNICEAGAKANLLLKNKTEAERYLLQAKAIFPNNENIAKLEKEFNK